MTDPRNQCFNHMLSKEEIPYVINVLVKGGLTQLR